MTSRLSDITIADITIVFAKGRWSSKLTMTECFGPNPETLVTMSTSPIRKRLRFDRAELTETATGQSRVTVTLTLGQLIFRASAESDTPGDGSPLKAAAQATLEAVQEAAANKFACSLADLDHVNALGKDLIAVLVDIRSHGRDVQVFGSCQIADNEIDCAVKAALNATNRMFELATREQ